MKLSEFFANIHWLWESHNLAFLGMIAVVYIAIAYFANRIARNWQSNAVTFSGFAFALFFALATTQGSKTSVLFANPVIHVAIAALIGVGAEVYRRLIPTRQ